MQRILAIDPAPKGVAVAVMEDPPLRLVFWGGLRCERKDGRICRKSLARIIRTYRPTAIVAKNTGSNRYHPLERTIGRALIRAGRGDLTPIPVSLDDVKKVFSRYGATTKQGVAEMIVRIFPELQPAPRPRTTYDPEHSRMSVYDAVALALTQLAGETKKPPTSAAGYP